MHVSILMLARASITTVPEDGLYTYSFHDSRLFLFSVSTYSSCCYTGCALNIGTLPHTSNTVVQGGYSNVIIILLNVALILHCFHLLGHLSSVCAPSVPHIMWCKTHFRGFWCSLFEVFHRLKFRLRGNWILIHLGWEWCDMMLLGRGCSGDGRWLQEENVKPLVWARWHYPPTASMQAALICLR